MDWSLWISCSGAFYAACPVTNLLTISATNLVTKSITISVTNPMSVSILNRFPGLSSHSLGSQTTQGFRMMPWSFEAAGFQIKPRVFK